MELNQILIERRSIRKYTAEEISIDDLKEIIKAGMYAPSARNQQPWHFIIISDKNKLNDLSIIHPYGKMLAEADKAILLCADETLEKSPGYWPIDCAAATQNMLLKSYDMGIGAVWLGVYPREDRMISLADYLRLTNNVKPFALISFGYPDEIKEVPNRYNPDRIHLNDW